jgi:hypothetical protein
MRAISPHDARLRGSAKASAMPARAIEKLSASSALKRERQDAHGERKETSAPLQVELVCRDDTSHFDPFWDAPRLVPTFVTQLLGQAMPERRENIGVETAYGRAASARKALLLDRKS